MKKVIAICLFVIGLTSAKAAVVPEYHKSKGGIFGYKYVTTTNWGDKIVVACSDPGLTRCRMAATLVMPDGPDLTPDDVSNIDKTVTSLLTTENVSGKLVYNNTFVVTYSYDIDADDMMFKVYSMGQAKSLGLI